MLIAQGSFDHDSCGECLQENQTLACTLIYLDVFGIGGRQVSGVIPSLNMAKKKKSNFFKIYIYCGGHQVMYRIVEAVCCTPETNLMYVNYT